MKTLEAFWHWVDNEKPETILLGHRKHLSPTALSAIDIACEAVADRLKLADDTGMTGLRAHWPALRDLSLAICHALEAMHEAIPEAGNGPVTASWTLKLLRPEPMRELHLNDPCPGCASDPCSGASPRCDVGRYMRENRLMSEWVTAQQLAAQDEQHALEMQRAAHMAPPARITPEAITTYVSGEYRPAVDPGRGRVVGVDWASRPPHVGDFVGDPVDRIITQVRRDRREYGCEPLETRFVCNGPGTVRTVAAPIEPGWTELAPVAAGLGKCVHCGGVSFHLPECVPAGDLARGGRVYLGQTRSHYDPVERCLEIFTTLTVSELDSFRGIKPRLIILRGEPHDYSAELRYGIACLLSPLLVYAAINTPECKQGLAAWGL